MRVIEDISVLQLPEKQLDFLNTFLSNIKSLKYYSRIDGVILFGSCATGKATPKSDVDILIIDEYADLDDDLLFELYDCAIDSTSLDENYVASDVLAMPQCRFDKYYQEPGMVQRRIYRDGVIIHESIYKR